MKKFNEKILVVLLAGVFVIGGCGKEAEDSRSVPQLIPFNENSEQVQGGSSESAGGDTGIGLSGGNPDTGLSGEGTDISSSAKDTDSDRPEQITDQSFDITLEGWGEVTFAPFMPESRAESEEGGVAYRDVRFCLMRAGETVYAFPGFNEDNVQYGQQFKQVVSVAFRDYNEDGRKDILLILEYLLPHETDGAVSVRKARAYTQEEGQTEFVIDSHLTEYLEQTGCDDMEALGERLEEYSRHYHVATGISTWEVERFAARVKKLLLAGDYESLSQEVFYPIRLGNVTYDSREAFLAAGLAESVSQDFLKSLEAASTQNMFVNYQGIMLSDNTGGYEVWIAEALNEDLSSQGLKVIAVNGFFGREE